MLTVTGNPAYTTPQVSSLVNLSRRGKGRRKGWNFIYPMMQRVILYYQASERT